MSWPKEKKKVKIYDRHGVEKNWDWLVKSYGPLVIHPANKGLGWKIVELREDADLAKYAGKTLGEIQALSPQASPALMVQVRSADGKPVDMMKIAWYWPDVREDPASMPLNGLPAGIKPNRAEYGTTNLNGDVGFGMGRGAYYYPPAIGPHAVWMYGQNTDVVLGLGMIGETNHHHLNVVYQQVVVDDTPVVPPPEETPTDGIYWGTLWRKLDRIIELLENW